MNWTSTKEQPVPNERDEFGDSVPFLVFDQSYGPVVAIYDDATSGAMRAWNWISTYSAAENGYPIYLERVPHWARVEWPR
jgi:hypothetical protein